MSKKQSTIKMSLDPTYNKINMSDLVVHSHDKNSYQLNFEFSDGCGNPLPLIDAKPRILFVLDNDIMQLYQLKIDSERLGEASFTFVEPLLHYQGIASAYVYVDYENKKHDVGGFKLRFKKSAIDGEMPEIEGYIEDIDKALKKVDELETTYAPRLTGVEGEIDVARGGASTLGKRLDGLNVRMNDVIQSADLDPNKDIEVVDGRRGASTLGEKIGSIDADLADLLGGKIKKEATTYIRSTDTPEYYIISPSRQGLLESGKRYAIQFMPNTTFTEATIQIGTTTSSSSMIDVLGDNVLFVKNTPYWIEDYIPSKDGLGYIRFNKTALNIDRVTIYEYETVGGRVPSLESKINMNDNKNDFHLATKLNGNLKELRTLQNVIDKSVSSLTRVQSTDGITKTATIPSVGEREKYILRVGLHYGSEKYTPSENEIFLGNQSKTDFSDVRFFDANGKMLKAQFGKPVNMELLEDNNLKQMLKVTSGGTIVGFEKNVGITLSADNGVTYTAIPNTANVTTNVSSSYNRTDMYPVFVDSNDNIFAYAGGKLYKLYANDSYSTIKEVLDFSWDNNGTIIYPDIQDHGMDENQNGTLIVGADYQTQRHVNIFRSTDGGEKFELSYSNYNGDFQHTHHIHADKYSNKVYAGIDDGGTTFKGARILFTDDDGATWIDVTDRHLGIRGRDYYPNYFGANYKLGGGESYYNGGGTIYKADADDDNFEVIEKGLAGVRSYADFGTDDLIVAGVQQATGTTVNQILISESQGDSWDAIYTKQQDFTQSSGGGFRQGHNAITLQGDTEPCIVFSSDFGNVKPMRLYKGGNHYYREAYIELENISDAPIDLTIKTGYMMEYPYDTLNGREHDGLVYEIPLNEGVGSYITDSLGNIVKIDGNEFEWDNNEEPVRYGDYTEFMKPFMPSSGLRLKQGTKINFGKIPELNFSKGYTITFWINPKNRWADPQEYSYRWRKVLGLFSVGNILFFNSQYDFGYGEPSLTYKNMDATGYSMMQIANNGYGYSDQYFFISITVDELGKVETYLNGGNTRKTYSENALFTLSNLSDGDFIIGTDPLQNGGFLSDIKIYNRVIPEKEIMEMYKGW